MIAFSGSSGTVGYMLRRRRAFTLLELIVAMAMLFILISISLAPLTSTFTSGQASGERDRVQIAEVEARRIASLPGNHLVFPLDTVSQMVLSSPMTIGAGAANASGTGLSGSVVAVTGNPNTLVITGMSPTVTGGGASCIILYDNGQGAVYWAQSSISQAACVASNYTTSAAITRWGTTGSGSTGGAGTKSNPYTFANTWPS